MSIIKQKTFTEAVASFPCANACCKASALEWDFVKIYLDSQREGESGDMVEGLKDEEVGEPQSVRFLCEWPGCPYETDDKPSLEIRVRQIHDRILWVCPTRICHRRFATEEETWDHIEVEHCGSSVDSPTISLE